MSKFLEDHKLLKFEEFVKILKMVESVHVPGADSYGHESSVSRAILDLFKTAKILAVVDRRGSHWNPYTVKNIKDVTDRGGWKGMEAISTYADHRDYKITYNTKKKRVEILMHINDSKYDFYGNKKPYPRVDITFEYTREMFEVASEENWIVLRTLYYYRMELEERHEKYLAQQKKIWMTKMSIKIMAGTVEGE